MSETYFSKLKPNEKIRRLTLLANSQCEITIWKKAHKERYLLKILSFDEFRSEIVLNTKTIPFPPGTELLCSFEIQGMYFFTKVRANISIADHFILETKDELFKSEKRGSFRLLTYLIHEVHCEFEKVEYRIQDISTTGLCLHVGELETPIFPKDLILSNLKLTFPDETIIIPEAKVVYNSEFTTKEKILKFKVGLNFQNLSVTTGDQIGRQINQLLRSNDSNLDFEKFSQK